METLVIFARACWETLAPTTWLMLLGLLVSAHFLRKTLL